MNDYNNNNSEGENFDDIFQPKLTRADVREEVGKALRDIGSFSAQAQAAVANAIREVSSVHADFEQKRSQMLATLEELPILKDAISAAESNPQLAPTLPQMYEVLYRASQAPANNNATPASEPTNPESQDLSDEGTQYRASLASQKVDLSPQNRKSLIAELEKRGVGDIEF